LAGLLLMMRDMSLSNGLWARTPMGIGISVGAAAALLALVVGMAVTAPAAKRLGPQKPGAAPISDEQRAALMKRLSASSRVTFVFLCIAALFMATARYF